MLTDYVESQRCGHRRTVPTRASVRYISFDIKGGPMSRTVIDLDDDLVADVARTLGTRTKKETVNTALREVLENRRRALALTRLREAAADGAFDLELLADKENYRG
jgi:Arc/MetJ family transcription regulator